MKIPEIVDLMHQFHKDVGKNSLGQKRNEVITINSAANRVLNLTSR
jgi:hypothetical protein